MSEELDDLIPITQEKVGAIISKPRMTEKLLIKPPFRFLHDVISGITRETGFAEGLYEGNELKAKEINGREGKIAYLDKIVRCVGICLGEPIDIKNSKVVAGQKAENTNIFLQKLAVVATRQDGDYDFDHAVSLALDETEPGSVSIPLRGGGKRDERDDHHDDKHDDDDGGGKGIDSDDDIPSFKDEDNANSKNDDTGNGLPNISQSIKNKLNECDGDWERTTELFSGLIKKPKLIQKLLSKPPFRFMQDVILNTISATGFGDGLYNDDESNTKVKRDKQGKINWLDKSIRLVGIHLRVTDLDVQPSKIAAGLEAEKTNKFLQYFAIAAKSLPQSSNTVELVLQGLGPNDVAEGGFTPSPSPIQDIEINNNRNNNNNDDDSIEDIIEEKSNIKNNIDSDDDDDDVIDYIDNNNNNSNNSDIEESVQDFKSEYKNENRSSRPQTIKPNRPPQYDPLSEAKNSSNDDLNQGSSRPKTARKRPPKFKENVQEGKRIIKDEKKISGIMIEGEGDSDEESDDDIIDDDDILFTAEKKDSNIHDDKGQVHSKLVRDIMKQEEDAKKNENEKKSNDIKDDKDSKPDADSGIRLGRLRKSNKKKIVSSGFSKEEISKLREAVQSVCQSTNPLGKSVDYIHDDLSTMNRELELWKDDYRKKTEMLDLEKRETDELLQPLRIKLMELDEQIQDQTQKVNTVQANILRNDNRIKHLLNNICAG